MSKPCYFMVFDVESVGLHGEGFAFGYVVIDAEGREVEAFRTGCDPEQAEGTADGLAWVQEHCHWDEDDYFLWGRELVSSHCAGPPAVRDAFWQRWRVWRKRGAVLAADCPWPVEARFLAACVDDRPVYGEPPRAGEGPYPLIDVASVRLAAGLDPLGTEPRHPNELPQHDPLADARQSARLLIEALRMKHATPVGPELGL